MANTEGYKEILKPWLETKLNQSFPDPIEFTGDPEYLYAAKTASIFKKVVAEILMYIDQQVEQAKALERKKKGEAKSKFNIGA